MWLEEGNLVFLFIFITVNSCDQNFFERERKEGEKEGEGEGEKRDGYKAQSFQKEQCTEKNAK